MKYKINDIYSINSDDITRISYSIIRKYINKNKTESEKAQAFFPYINSDMLSYVNKNIQDETGNFQKLFCAYNEFDKILDNNNLDFKKDIKFYIDNFHYIEYDNGTYVLYAHKNLYGAPTPENIGKQPVPIKDRVKPKCYPSSIKNSFKYCFNQSIIDSDVEDDELIKYIQELINKLLLKVNEIKVLLK
jgi:hypothetical protein